MADAAALLPQGWAAVAGFQLTDVAQAFRMARADACCIQPKEEF